MMDKIMNSKTKIKKSDNPENPVKDKGSMSEWKIYTDIENYNWNDWKKFPDPRKGDYLEAPYGFGVYQLRNKKTKEYILFGRGKNLAYRMSSILPEPFGCGKRNNNKKRKYVLKKLKNIEYRTVAFTNEKAMKDCEQEIKKLCFHKFNT